ncbi:MAG: metalloregulator ArsR/SmtB family transcription factor [Bacillota bacterium]|nr:metalloregulator ArsR/SmtB family transcription factor [Bacillota bacterium]
MEEKAKQLAELLKLLANRYRLMIFCALMDGPMSVNKLLEKVPQISQSALSQHLALLRAHEILDYKKTGLTVTYFIVDHRVEEIIHVLKKYYCDGEDLK